MARLKDEYIKHLAFLLQNSASAIKTLVGYNNVQEAAIDAAMNALATQKNELIHRREDLAAVVETLQIHLQRAASVLESLDPAVSAATVAMAEDPEPVMESRPAVDNSTPQERLENDKLVGIFSRPLVPVSGPTPFTEEQLADLVKQTEPKPTAQGECAASLRPRERPVDLRNATRPLPEDKTDHLSAMESPAMAAAKKAALEYLYQQACEQEKQRTDTAKDEIVKTVVEKNLQEFHRQHPTATQAQLKEHQRALTKIVSNFVLTIPTPTMSVATEANEGKVDVKFEQRPDSYFTGMYSVFSRILRPDVFPGGRGNIHPGAVNWQQYMNDLAEVSEDDLLTAFKTGFYSNKMTATSSLLLFTGLTEIPAIYHPDLSDCMALPMVIRQEPFGSNNYVRRDINSLSGDNLQKLYERICEMFGLKP